MHPCDHEGLNMIGNVCSYNSHQALKRYHLDESRRNLTLHHLQYLNPIPKYLPISHALPLTPPATRPTLPTYTAITHVHKMSTLFPRASRVHSSTSATNKEEKAEGKGTMNSGGIEIRVFGGQERIGFVGGVLNK